MAEGIKKVFQTSLTDVASTDLEGLGTIRFEGNNIYKWVHLLNTTATAAVVVGDSIEYAALTGYGLNKVVSDHTDAGAANTQICAGCAVGSVAGVKDTSYYIWVQIKGPVTTTKDLPGTADGITITTSGGTGTGDGLFLAAAAGDSIAGVIIDESANTMIVDCPF